MLRKKVKLLLEQLQVCIFAKIVFGVRCTLIQIYCIKRYLEFNLSMIIIVNFTLNIVCFVALEMLHI